MKNTRHLQVWFCVSDVLRIQNQTVTLWAEAGIPKITLIHSKRQGAADTSLSSNRNPILSFKTPTKLLDVINDHLSYSFIKGNNLT